MDHKTRLLIYLWLVVYQNRFCPISKKCNNNPVILSRNNVLLKESYIVVAHRQRNMSWSRQIILSSRLINDKPQ